MNSSVSASASDRTPGVNWLSRAGSAGEEEHYGPCFWPRANILFPHMLGGTNSIIIGPFQFWPMLRKGHTQVHRVSGRVYPSAILVGSVAGFALAVTSSVHPANAAGLFGLCTAWALTSGMAFISIRNRNIAQHRQWMVRSYVVTFALVTFRIGSDLLKHYGILEFPDTSILMSWLSWAVPLLFTGVALQWKQATRIPRG